MFVTAGQWFIKQKQLAFYFAEKQNFTKCQKHFVWDISCPVLADGAVTTSTSKT